MSNRSTKPPKKPEKWLDKEANRDKLKMAGAALGAIAVAAWVVFVWLHNQPPTVAGAVCRGEHPDGCPPTTTVVGCDPENLPELFLADQAKKCRWFETFNARSVMHRDGNKCGYNAWEYSCNFRW
jgi:hypothetical protein